jgi:hypothetical protein
MEHYAGQIRGHSDYNTMLDSERRKGVDTNDMGAVTRAYL